MNYNVYVTIHLQKLKLKLKQNNFYACDDSVIVKKILSRHLLNLIQLDIINTQIVKLWWCDISENNDWIKKI